MELHELIWEFQDKIIEVYNKEDLFPLRGRNDDYKINGREILTWYAEVTQKNASKYNLHSTYFDIQNDLFICSDELIYFTAHLFLYKPFINNPLFDSQVFNGKEIFPNYQNLEAKRYNMFADVVSQKAYNYWDRIGDLIASFFPEKLEAKQIYFPTSIEVIPKLFHKSQNYIWLNNFKNTEYKSLNKLRKQIVHYTTTDTDYRQKHLQIPMDKAAMILLQKEREELPGYYKNHINLTLAGFEKTMLLFEEFNASLF
jgi:hypothetical protein